MVLGVIVLLIEMKRESNDAFHQGWQKVDEIKKQLDNQQFPDVHEFPSLHDVNDKSSNNEIYAFSKKSDIYSFGMIMWELYNKFSWYDKSKNKAEFNQAEAIREKLIKSKKIFGPELAEKWHSETIYTSRLLTALISKLSTNSYSTISFGNKQEKELDIDIMRCFAPGPMSLFK
ncbi:hypothetical protein RhiirA4_457385 [Rhizophagus irregularis]|uniref:Protein kinase domain-containing protein n=1 Tax=Rhizophagus irregularis TaxID=588596 RepID=A0A2I1G9U8_9GLOM|nr:hypothetical protein RhiirA4_457385 [Rhizophagus irregularis]